MRLHLVDGTYELYRAHYAKRPEHTLPDGTDVKATVGIASSILALLRDPAEAVTHLAVAFDNPIRSFRNALFEGYKSDEGVPPELRAQFDRAEEAMRALGVVVWSMDEHEADDALATAAARFRGEVSQVRLLTPDKDLGQCVRGRSVVQVDRRQAIERDENYVQTVFGVAPASIPDLLALVGDDADGIPGLRGFGRKSAGALLARYGKLEEIPANAASWDVSVRGAAKLSATLEAHREEARLYRTLATLVEDAPIDEELSALAWKGVPRKRFEAWCDELHLGSFRSRPTRWR